MAPPDVAVDTRAAQAYERYLVPALMRPVASQGVAAAAPRPGEAWLDVACGTGIVARLAGPGLSPGGRVAGVDIDPAMIVVAPTLAPATSGVSFDWHCASAQEMPFKAAVFDAVTCMQGLQYMPDCAAVLAEIRRVLKKPGRLIAIVWTTLEGCAGQHAIAQALARRGIDTAPILKAYSLGKPAQVEPLARAAGFSSIDIRISTATARFPSSRDFVKAFAAGSMSSSAAIAKVPALERDGFMAEIVQTLQRYEDGEGVVLPVEFLVLVARP